MSELKLSNQQKEFLTNLINSKSVSRRVSNRTGQSLRTMGLTRYAMMVGWVLTEAGIKVASNLKTPVEDKS